MHVITYTNCSVVTAIITAYLRTDTIASSPVYTQQTLATLYYNLCM